MTLTPEQKKRRTRSFALLIVVFLASLTAIEIVIQQLNNPVPIVNNLLVFVLVNVNIILLVVLIIVVVRNLATLYLERKSNILGAKFQTKLIASFIILSLVPSLLLFIVASNIITQSIEGWFDVQVEHSLRESVEVAQTFYDNSIKNSLYFAEQISELLTDKRLLQEEENLYSFLRNKQREFNLGLIEVYTLEGGQLAHAVNPNIPTGDFDLSVSDIILRIGKRGERDSLTASTERGDLIKSIVPIHSKWEHDEIIGILLVDYFVDGRLASKMKSIRGAFEEYKKLKILSNPIRVSYLLTFFLITLLVFFLSIFLGMRLAKEMIVPIQRLATAAKAVAEGNLDHKVQIEVSNEAGILVDLFNQMTENVKKTTDALKEVNRRQSEFLSTVSHELRTPLAPIKSCIENMLDQMYGRITEKQRNRLERALGRVNEEVGLIENLLDLVRIQEGRVKVDLNLESVTNIVHDVVQVFEYNTNKKHIELKTEFSEDDDLMTQLDRGKIKQVLSNLIGNAIKFTPEGGTITVSASNDNELIKIQVSDTGIGIPEDKLEKIFDRFYQVDSSLTRKVGGTGIGLNIAKEYIELHKGKIWAESMLAEGTTFTFILPKIDKE